MRPTQPGADLVTWLAAAAAAEHRHSQVFAAITDAVMVTDLAGRILDVNPAAERTFARSRDELVGGVLGALGLARVRTTLAEISAIVDANGSWHSELPIRRGDGQLSLLDTTIVRMLDADGTRQGLAVIGVDVTEERRVSAELAQAEQVWRLTFDGAPSGIALVWIDGSFSRVNAAMTRILGRDEATLLRLRLHDLCHPDDLDDDLHLQARLLSGEIDTYSCEKRLLHASGHDVWVEFSVSVIVDPATYEPLHLVVQVEDVTERRRTAERQHAIGAAQLAIAGVELSPQKVMHQICQWGASLLSATGAIVELREGNDMVFRATTESHAAQLGVRLDVGRSFSGLCLTSGLALVCYDTADDPRVDAAFCEAAHVRSIAVVPLRHRGQALGVLTVLSDTTRAFDATDLSTLELLAAPFGNAITNAQELEATSAQAMTDPLTGLPNRPYVLHELSRALDRQQRHGGHTAVLFIDLDGFKAVNDTYGHEAGDDLLRQIGERLRVAVRATDTPARYGGDEFLVVCEALGAPGDVKLLADRLVDSLPGTYVVDGNGVTIGASVGVAVADVAVDAMQLLRTADRAMYAAKQAGGNRHEITHVT